MWELSDVNKKKLGKGTKIEDIIYTPYKKYLAFLNKYKANFTRMKVELLDNFAKVSGDQQLTSDHFGIKQRFYCKNSIYFYRVYHSVTI